MPLPASYGMPAAAQQRTAPKKSRSTGKLLLVIGLSSLVVLAIVGIGVTAFLFLPFGRGYATPEAAFQAMQKASEERDWKTVYDVLTPESSHQLVATLAWTSRLIVSLQPDSELSAILDKHGVAKEMAQPNLSPLSDPSQMFTQLQKQMSSAADSIQDKRGFFVEVMNRMAEIGEENKKKLGGTQFEDLFSTDVELRDVTINGDTAEGKVQAGAIQMPMYFQKIDGGWRIRIPTLQDMMNQAGGLPGMNPGSSPTPPSDLQMPAGEQQP